MAALRSDCLLFHAVWERGTGMQAKTGGRVWKWERIVEGRDPRTVNIIWGAQEKNHGAARPHLPSILSLSGRQCRINAPTSGSWTSQGRGRGGRGKLERFGVGKRLGARRVACVYSFELEQDACMLAI